MTAKKKHGKHTTTTDTAIGVKIGKENDPEEKKIAIATEIETEDGTTETTAPTIAKDVTTEAKTPTTTATATMTVTEKENETAKNETEIQTAIERKMTDEIATVIETAEMIEGIKIVMDTKTSETTATAEVKTEETMAGREIVREIAKGRGTGGPAIIGAMWLSIVTCLPVVETTRNERASVNEIVIVIVIVSCLFPLGFWFLFLGDSVCYQHCGVVYVPLENRFFCWMVGGCDHGLQDLYGWVVRMERKERRKVVVWDPSV